MQALSPQPSHASARDSGVRTSLIEQPSQPRARGGRECPARTNFHIVNVLGRAYLGTAESIGDSDWAPVMWNRIELDIETHISMLPSYRNGTDKRASRSTRCRTIFAQLPVSICCASFSSISVDVNRSLLYRNVRRNCGDRNGKLQGAASDAVSHVNVPQTHTQSVSLFIRLAMIIDGVLFPRELRSSLESPARLSP